MSTDVWFEFNSAAGGTFEVSLCGGPGTLTDSTLIVYDGTAGCPAPGDPGIACDDDTCAPAAGGANFMSTVTVTLAAGQPLLIQAGGWNGSEGDSALTITEQVAAPTGIVCTDNGIERCSKRSIVSVTDAGLNDCTATLGATNWIGTL